MARRRRPFRIEAQFRCVVFGQPRSFQTKEGEKDRKYAKWRAIVADQVLRAVKEQSKDRSFEPFDEPVLVRLLWYTLELESGSHPDLDNIAKPYIDALRKDAANVISDDRLIRDARIVKIDMNNPPLVLAEAEEAMASDQFEGSDRQFVLIMVRTLRDSSWSKTMGADFDE